MLTLILHCSFERGVKQSSSIPDYSLRTLHLQKDFGVHASYLSTLQKSAEAFAIHTSDFDLSLLRQVIHSRWNANKVPGESYLRSLSCPSNLTTPPKKRLSSFFPDIISPNTNHPKSDFTVFSLFGVLSKMASKHPEGLQSPTHKNQNESNTLTMSTHLKKKFPSSEGPNALSDPTPSSSAALPSQTHDKESAAKDDWPDEAVRMLLTVQEVCEFNRESGGVDWNEHYRAKEDLHNLALPMILLRCYPDLKKPGADFGALEVREKYEKLRKAGKLQFWESNPKQARNIMQAYLHDLDVFLNELGSHIETLANEPSPQNHPEDKQEPVPAGNSGNQHDREWKGAWESFWTRWILEWTGLEAVEKANPNSLDQACRPIK